MDPGPLRSGPGTVRLLRKGEVADWDTCEQCRNFLFRRPDRGGSRTDRDDASAAHPDRDAAVPLFRRGDETPPCGVYPEYVIVVGLDPGAGISVYAASKSYIRKFSQMLRYELHQYGVGVTTVCPRCDSDGIVQP